MTSHTASQESPDLRSASAPSSRDTRQAAQPETSPGAQTPTVAQASPGDQTPARPYAARNNVAKRFNWRIWLFVVAILAIPGVIGYVYISDMMTGGIRARGDFYEVDLKALGYFEFDPQKSTEQSIPAHYRELDGKRVLLRGEMFSETGARSSQDFQLVYSIAKCCFGGPPKVQERVFVHASREVPIYGGFVDVLGTFHVKVERDEAGVARSIYTMEVEQIKPL